MKISIHTDSQIDETEITDYLPAFDSAAGAGDFDPAHFRF